LCDVRCALSDVRCALRQLEERVKTDDREAAWKQMSEYKAEGNCGD